MADWQMSADEPPVAYKSGLSRKEKLINLGYAFLGLITLATWIWWLKIFFEYIDIAFKNGVVL